MHLGNVKSVGVEFRMMSSFLCSYAGRSHEKVFVLLTFDGLRLEHVMSHPFDT